MTNFDSPSASGTPSVLVFDVNETLLDIESLGPHFERIFGDAKVLRTWFGELVTYSMTLTLSGYYVDFFTLGRAVLQMVATIRDVTPTDDDLQSLAEGMRTMPAHPDVAPGLASLRADGYRLVTLTNSPIAPTWPRRWTTPGSETSSSTSSPWTPSACSSRRFTSTAGWPRSSGSTPRSA